MSALIDLTGRVFGRLTVIRRHGSVGNNTGWECLCSCGNTRTISRENLRVGRTKSCGCLRKDLMTTHGLSKHDGYNSWSDMIKRCTYKDMPVYRYYGGRGVKVCERWMSLENFLSDMGPRPSKRHSIDRIDNDGDYEPSNCRWATQTQQNRNRRARSLSISGINGVIWNRGKWLVNIGVNYKQINLGRTDDFFEACCLRKSAENKYWGES